MKKFNIPKQYSKSLIKSIKSFRKDKDKLKKDLSTFEIDLGKVSFHLPRNFGFCYGVENAISITYKLIEENREKQKTIYLLSELIHNPQVNSDLISKGVKFLMDLNGNNLIPFNVLQKDDIVITPAFGTTIEIENKLLERGIQINKYDSTCPFVKRVWKKGNELNKDGYTIILHGKPEHEETKSTFSHINNNNNPCIIIENFNEIEILARYILEQPNLPDFNYFFSNRYSKNFDYRKDLTKLGVINQTTILASETENIVEFLKKTLIKKYNIDANDVDEIKKYFANTNDTLCYATNENQKAVEFMVAQYKLDAVVVIGGKNSSNTCNLFKICNEKVRSFFIENEMDIISEKEILSYDVYSKSKSIIKHNLFEKEKINIGIVIGASCPDYMIESIIKKVMFFYEEEVETEKKLVNIKDKYTIQPL